MYRLSNVINIFRNLITIFLGVIFLAIFLHFTLSQNLDCQTKCIDTRNQIKMTFYKNKYAIDSNCTKIPQLNCVGGDGCSMNDHIVQIQCTGTSKLMKCKTEYNVHNPVLHNIVIYDYALKYDACESKSDEYGYESSFHIQYKIQKNNAMLLSILISVGLPFFIFVTCFLVLYCRKVYLDNQLNVNINDEIPIAIIEQKNNPYMSVDEESNLPIANQVDMLVAIKISTIEQVTE